MENNDRDTKILTVAGKGGVGKTSISSAMVRILTEEYPDARILAIDADPAIGLTTALGVEPTDTLDGIRKKIVDSVVAEDNDNRIYKFTVLRTAARRKPSRCSTRPDSGYSIRW